MLALHIDFLYVNIHLRVELANVSFCFTQISNNVSCRHLLRPNLKWRLSNPKFISTTSFNHNPQTRTVIFLLRTSLKREWPRGGDLVLLHSFNHNPTSSIPRNKLLVQFQTTHGIDAVDELNVAQVLAQLFHSRDIVT